MRKEFDEKQLKQNEILNRKEETTVTVLPEKSLIRERHEAEFAKWLKQQDNIGNGLFQRVEQRMGQNPTLDPSMEQVLHKANATTIASLK